MNGRYLALAGRIRQELDELDRVVRRVQRFWARAERSGDEALVDATALNLHGYYAGVERIFESVATNVDEFVPSGKHWHRDLLAQMASAVPGVRPPVLPPEVQRRLDIYRGFRHVVRNVYTYNLDPEQVGRLARELPQLAEEVKRALLAFAEFLERSAQE